MNKRVMRLCNRLDDMFAEDTAQHRNALQDEVINLGRYVGRLEAVASAARAVDRAAVEAYEQSVDWRLKQALTAALAALDSESTSADGDGEASR